MESFDIAVIGAGPGGYSTALRAAQLGKSVALIERDATLGGTCLNRGCIPSKALITATHTIDTVHRAAELGVNASVNGIDFGRLRDYRLHIVDLMTKGLAGLLAHRGVSVFHGEVVALASVDMNSDGTPMERPAYTLTVSGRDGAAVERFVKAGVPEPLDAHVEIGARDVVVATGSRPRPLPGIGFRGALIDSTQALELDEFPASAVIVGSGAVALEFASMWATAGSDVTLLIRKDRVLSGWDRRASMTLTRELKRHGVTIITHTNVTQIDTGANLGATVHYEKRNSAGEIIDRQTVWGEIALAAIGRDPITDADWITNTGLTLDEHGMVVTDPFGRTNLPGVWAIGDITEGPALAHRAFEQGIVVAESIAGLDPKPVDDLSVPQVVFSSPEAASVGLTLDQAQSLDDLVSVSETVYPMLGNARMLMSGSAGSMSVVSGAYASDPDMPVVLGVHIVSPLASDLIAEAEQLVGNHVPLHDAARLIHPHPTFAETLGEALLKADGRPLHTR